MFASLIDKRLNFFLNVQPPQHVNVFRKTKMKPKKLIRVKEAMKAMEAMRVTEAMMVMKAMGDMEANKVTEAMRVCVVWHKAMRVMEAMKVTEAMRFMVATKIGGGVAQGVLQLSKTPSLTHESVKWAWPPVYVFSRNIFFFSIFFFNPIFMILLPKMDIVFQG